MLPSNPLKKNASSLVFSLNVRALSVPDKRGVSGQTPVKDSDMTQQNKWSTWEDWKRSTSIDPSKLSESDVKHCSL